MEQVADFEQKLKKKILILAPFFTSSAAWIDDFCQRQDFKFKKQLFLSDQVSWHQRGPKTPLREWWALTKYAHGAMSWRPDCVVTCFPQLAIVMAALNTLQFWKPKQPLIAWNFNLGHLPTGLKKVLVGFLLQKVDLFVVHSRGEIESYSRLIGVPEQRFRFVPLQKGDVGKMKPSTISGDYIVSMGSANRDYETFVGAIAGTGIRSVVISKRDIIDGLPDCLELTKLSGLSANECDSIMNGALVNVVPTLATDTAAGQVTFTTGMRMGIPTIATLAVGSRDYIENGKTGLLVEPRNPKLLRQAIEQLWFNPGLRADISRCGKEHADRYFSDEAAAQHLAETIDELV
jgi:hypothetical protein